MRIGRREVSHDGERREMALPGECTPEPRSKVSPGAMAEAIDPGNDEE